MAKIIIKGRVDPIIVDQKTALNVKRIWLDPTNEKTRRLDLGIWAGEYGQIRFIELEKLHKKNKAEIYRTRIVFIQSTDD